MSPKKPSLSTALQRQPATALAVASDPRVSPFPDLDAAVTSLTKLLPVASIDAMPGQPRQGFDDAALTELAASIAERGVLQPVRVKPLGADRYQLVAGERRWRASRRAGLDTIPAFICAPGDATDEFADALVENLLREDLSDIEVANGLKQLMEDWGVSQNEAARKLHLNKTKASHLLGLLNLPGEIRSNVQNGLLSLAHVVPLLPDGIDDTQRIALAREAIREGWGSRRLEHRVKEVRAGVTIQRGHGGGAEALKRRPRASAPVPADRLEYAKRWAEALSQRTGVDITVTPMRGPGYQIRVADHASLTELGVKFGLDSIEI